MDTVDWDAPATLHGVQLWVCLPDSVRNTTPAAFTHLADLPTINEPGAELKVYEGAPHGIFVTHLERVNQDLLRFIRA